MAIRKRKSKNQDSVQKLAPKPKKKLQRMDTVFLVIVLILVTFGLVMVFSASYASALYYKDNSLHFIAKQAIFVLVGLIAMVFISYIDYRIYKKFVYYIYGIGVILLVIVLFMEPINEAKRWIIIGPINFQPSEIMKFAIIVLFSYFISINYKKMDTAKYGLLPFAIFLFPVVGLMMLQPHLSGTILIFLIGCILMFVGGTKIRYFILLGGGAGLGVVGIVMLKGVTYMTERLKFWLDPFADVSDKTFQTIQSLIAIGSGGIMGRGIGNSTQKYMFLPEPQNDFIFAIICEELGLIGALLVIALFIFFAFRGFSIASKSPDKFSYMLCIGLTAQICIQAILNIAVVTNTIPNTGISLPFFSYGGTAIMMQLAQMGVILNISRHAVIEKP